MNHEKVSGYSLIRHGRRASGLQSLLCHTQAKLNGEATEPKINARAILANLNIVTSELLPLMGRILKLKRYYRMVFFVMFLNLGMCVYATPTRPLPGFSDDPLTWALPDYQMMDRVSIMINANKDYLIESFVATEDDGFYVNVWLEDPEPETTSTQSYIVWYWWHRDMILLMQSISPILLVYAARARREYNNQWVLALCLGIIPSIPGAAAHPADLVVRNYSFTIAVVECVFLMEPVVILLLSLELLYKLYFLYFTCVIWDRFILSKTVYLILAFSIVLQTKNPFIKFAFDLNAYLFLDVFLMLSHVVVTNMTKKVKKQWKRRVRDLGNPNVEIPDNMNRHPRPIPVQVVDDEPPPLERMDMEYGPRLLQFAYEDDDIYDFRWRRAERRRTALARERERQEVRQTRLTSTQLFRMRGDLLRRNMREIRDRDHAVLVEAIAYHGVIADDERNRNPRVYGEQEGNMRVRRDISNHAGEFALMFDKTTPLSRIMTGEPGRPTDMLVAMEPFIAFAHMMCVCDTFPQYVSTVTLFLNAIGTSLTNCSVQVLALVLIFMGPEEHANETWFDKAKMALHVNEHVPALELGRKAVAAYTIAPLAVALGISPTKTAFSDWYNSIIPGMDCIGSFATIMEFLLHFVETGVACFKAGTLSPFLKQDKVGMWQESVGFIRENYHNATALQRKGYMVSGVYNSEYMDLLKTLQEDGNSLLYIAKNLNRTADATAIHYSLQALIKLEAQARTINDSVQLKRPPFAVMIVGMPGLGKTDLITELKSICACAMGLRDTDNNVCWLPLLDKWLGTLTNQEIALLSDWVTKRLDVNGSQGIDALTILDPAPQPIAKAAVEEKGKHVNKIQLFVGASNFLDLKAKDSHYSEPAVLRRFAFFVIPIVDPNVYIPAGPLNDRTRYFKYVLLQCKVLSATSYIWNIINKFGELYETITPIEAANGFPQAAYMDYEEMATVIRDAASAHVEDEEAIRQFRLKKRKAGHYCNYHQRFAFHCPEDCSGEEPALLPDPKIEALPSQTHVFRVEGIHEKLMGPEEQALITGAFKIVHIDYGLAFQIARYKCAGYWWNCCDFIAGKHTKYFADKAKACETDVINIALDCVLRDDVMDNFASSFADTCKKLAFAGLPPLLIAFLMCTGLMRLWRMVTGLRADDHKKANYEDMKLFAETNETFGLSTFKTTAFGNPTSRPVAKLNVGQQNMTAEYGASTLNKIQESMYRIHFEPSVTKKGYEIKSVTAQAWNYAGNLFLVNYHTIKSFVEEDLTVPGVLLSLGNNVSSKRAFFFNKDSVVKIWSERDLAVVCVHGPLGKDLRHLVATGITPGDGVAINVDNRRPLAVHFKSKCPEFDGQDAYFYNDQIFDHGASGTLIVTIHDNTPRIVAVHCRGVGAKGGFDSWGIPLPPLPNARLVAQDQCYSGAKLDFGPLSDRSFLHHLAGTPAEDNMYGEILGTNDMFRTKNCKSSLEKTPFWDESIGLEIPILGDFVRVVDGKEEWVSPFLQKAEAMLRHPPVISPRIHEIGKNFLLEELRKCVPPDYKPYNLDEAINGTVNGNGLKRDTAAGAPYIGKKSRYLLEVTEDKFIPTAELTHGLHVTRNCWLGRLSANCVINTKCKDEPIKTAKLYSGKVRLFNTAPFPILVWSKIYYGPIFDYMRSKRINLNSAVGINATSDEWRQFVGVLSGVGRTDFNEQESFADVDAEWYDVFNRMLGRVITILNDLIFEMHPWLVGTEHELIMRGLEHDLASFVAIFNGDIVKLEDITPSGLMGTAEFNIFCMRYYLGMAFGMLNINPGDRIILKQYGDDMLMRFSDSLLKEIGDLERLQQVLLKLGLPTTNGDKNGCLKFMCLTACKFLKRGLKYSEELKLWLAPLELKSIMKSLSFYDKTSPIPRREHMTNMLEQAQLQFWMHGRDVFSSLQGSLKLKLESFSDPVYSNMNPTWLNFDDVTNLYRNGAYVDYAA